jgi:sortase A
MADTTWSVTSRTCGVLLDNNKKIWASSSGMKQFLLRRRSRLTKASAALILIVGVGFLGDGFWLYGKAQVGQMLLSRAWAKTLEDGKYHKPWPWADHWPEARLISEEHNIDQIVLAGDSGSALAFAPGMNLQAAKPGEAGTVLISGHRDTHFRFLQNIKPGAEVTLQTEEGSHHYKVEDTKIVDSRTTRIDPTSDNGQLVLVTCYPFENIDAGGPMRLLVTLKIFKDGE